LLIVMAVLMILSSSAMMATRGLVTQAMTLKCHHRLEQIWQGCQLYALQHRGAFPQLWAEDTENPGTTMAWYETLLAEDCLETPDVLTCPLAEEANEVTEEFSTEGGAPAPPGPSELPALLYNAGHNRGSSDVWGHWDRFSATRDAFSQWFTEEGGGCFWVQDDGVPGPVYISSDILEGTSQMWIIDTVDDGGPRDEGYGPHGQDYQEYWTDDELNVLADFCATSGGLHFFFEGDNWPGCMWYWQASNDIEARIGYGILGFYQGGSRPGNPTFASNPHPVMDGVQRLQAVRPGGTPAELELDPGNSDAEFIAVVAGDGYPWIGAFDGGAGRVVVHGSFYQIISIYGGGLYSYDSETYFKNSYNWLRYATGEPPEDPPVVHTVTGACTYGYNNRLGQSRLTPASDTICVIDYLSWIVDHDDDPPEENDDDSYVALRHDGRANAVFADGRVQALCLSEIPLGAWTLEPGD